MVQTMGLSVVLLAIFSSSSVLIECFYESARNKAKPEEACFPGSFDEVKLCKVGYRRVKGLNA